MPSVSTPECVTTYTFTLNIPALNIPEFGQAISCVNTSATCTIFYNKSLELSGNLEKTYPVTVKATLADG